MPQVKKPCLFTAAQRHMHGYSPEPDSPDLLPMALCASHFVQHPYPTLARRNVIKPFAPRAEDRPEYERVNDKPLDRRLALR